MVKYRPFLVRRNSWIVFTNTCCKYELGDDVFTNAKRFVLAMVFVIDCLSAFLFPDLCLWGSDGLSFILHFQRSTMPSLDSSSRAVMRLFLCKYGGRQLISCLTNKPKLESYVQNRFFRSIAGVEAFHPSCQPFGGSHHEAGPLCLQNTHFSSLVQRRGFLGCSDGDQGGTSLSKVHEERCILG